MSVTPVSTRRPKPAGTRQAKSPRPNERTSGGTAEGRAGRDLRSRALLLVICCAIPVTLVLFATQRGIGFSADSVAYAHAGATFRAGGGFAFLDGSPFTFFPIGLPLIIALLGTGPALVAFNLLVLVAQVLVSYRLALAAAGSSRAALVVAAWVSVTISTIDIHAMLWSEPLFNLAANLAVLQLVLVHTRRRLTPATAVTLVASISVACSLRYVGCLLLPFAAVSVLAALRQSRARHAILASLGLVAVASTGLVATVMRNLALGVGPFGPRGGSDNSLPDVLFQVGTSTGNLLTNQAFDVGPFLCTIGWAAIGVLAGALIRGLRSWGLGGVLASPAAPVCGWLACYAVFICCSELTTSIDALDIRISSPMQTPLFIAFVLAVRQLVPAGSVRRLSTYVIVGLLMTTLALSVSWTAVASQQGLGIERAARGQDAWVSSLEQLPPQAGIITNAPFPVAWLGHGRLVAPAVDTFFFTTTSRAERVAELRAFVADTPATYALAVGEDASLVARPLQQAGFRLTVVAEEPAFTLYAVTLA